MVTWGWVPSSELAAELREAVLLYLPTMDSRWLSKALSCCRKLQLLPHEQLQWAFVASAQAVMPDLPPDYALALLARLLMPLQQQVNFTSVAMHEQLLRHAALSHA
jgi:hypothetical protein